MKKIQVLGMGCAKCNKLEENVRTAAQQLGIEYEIEKIKDINVITGFGVMLTPALVIDGQVKSAGKLLTVDEIRDMLIG